MDGKEETYVFAMPEVLKSRLSTQWIKCIDVISHSSLPSTSAQTILDDAHLRKGTTSISKAESWEDVLLVLTEEDAVVRDGHLKLQPIFFSLPKIVQTRFLNLVLHNASKICSHHLNTFVNKLESAEAAKDSWVQNMMASLRRCLNVDEQMEKNSFDQINPAIYKFSAASQKTLSDLLQKLKNENATSNNESSLTSNSSNSLTFHNQNVELKKCQKIVDVIIIDDDENEDLSDILLNDKFLEGPGQAHSNLKILKKTSPDTLNVEKDTKADRDVKKSLPKAGGLNDVSSETGTLEVTDVHTDHKNSTSKRALSPEIKAGSTPKVPKLDGEAVGELTSQTGSNYSEQTKVLLTDTVKAQLEKLKETFFGDSKSLGKGSSKIIFLLDLSSSELKTACEYLKLSDQTEESLISFCDCVPWAELEYRTALTLFTGCLFQKVTTSQSHVSQSLLTVVASVLRGQPKAVLDLLITAVRCTFSNEFQCQLLATLCKDALSHEWLCYLIKHLNEEPAVIVNDNILSVLQAVIDRRTELDPETLTSLLTLQVQGSQDLANSSRFGKCLMACLTKYGKKMTVENRAHFSSLVDTHCSNFKPALNAAFKRLNR